MFKEQKNSTSSSVVQQMENSLGVLSEAVKFNEWAFSQYRDYIRWGNIWDIGSGLGNMSKFLLSADFACLTEYDDAYREQLAKRFAGIANVKVEKVDLNQLDIEHFKAYGFDTIISTNVLEHVSDDLGAVKAITATMKAETVCITLVPAHPILYGSLDKSVAHYRRYTRKSLRTLLESGGHEVVAVNFFNRIAAIGWFLKFKILRTENISKNDVSMVERLLPILKMEKYLPAPFGLSLIAISRKRSP